MLTRPRCARPVPFPCPPPPRASSTSTWQHEHLLRQVSPETFKRALEQLRAESKLTSFDRRRPDTAPDAAVLFRARASATL
eukprot:1281119-Pleurochrysis_carterae.AAC.6